MILQPLALVLVILCTLNTVTQSQLLLYLQCDEGIDYVPHGSSVELSPGATVKDLMDEIQKQLNPQWLAIMDDPFIPIDDKTISISYAGVELVKHDQRLSDTGICPETKVVITGIHVKTYRFQVSLRAGLLGEEEILSVSVDVPSGCPDILKFATNELLSQGSENLTNNDTAFLQSDSAPFKVFRRLRRTGSSDFPNVYDEKGKMLRKGQAGAGVRTWVLPDGAGVHFGSAEEMMGYEKNVRVDVSTYGVTMPLLGKGNPLSWEQAEYFSTRFKFRMNNYRAILLGTITQCIHSVKNNHRAVWIVQNDTLKTVSMMIGTEPLWYNI